MRETHTEREAEREREAVCVCVRERESHGYLAVRMHVLAVALAFAVLESPHIHASVGICLSPKVTLKSMYQIYISKNQSVNQFVYQKGT